MPWPWEEPREKWIPYRNRLAKYLFLNIGVISFLLTLWKYIIGYDAYIYSVETLPSKTEIFW